MINTQDYTFERNIVTGKYGYALSTFEGVLDYILEAHIDLSKMSTKNVRFWSAIRTGDMDQVRKFIHDDAYDARDADGNNALMVACMYGQAAIADYLLQSPDHSRNDQNSTPLICAIQHGNSLDTVHLLLRDDNIKASVNTVFDHAGNTAVLYACSTNNIELVKTLLEEGDAQLDTAKSAMTHDSALHVAARNDSSMPFLLYVLQQFNDITAMNRRNNSGETVYHVCTCADFVKYVLGQVGSAKQVIMRSIDNHLGRSPIMAWAAKGRLDLVELLISDLSTKDCARVDNQGNTLLHLLAAHLTKGLVFGKKSLEFIIKKLKNVVHVREWRYGNTAIHFAAEISTLAATQNVGNAVLFIRTLVKYGAAVDAVNYKDEHPVNISKIPDVIACLDGKYAWYDNIQSCLTRKCLELHLNPILPITKHNTHQYTWAVTRPWIESSPDRQQSEIYYIITSKQVGKKVTNNNDDEKQLF